MFEIGNNLKEARLRRRVDLMDAEGATKIRSKYLSALETEDFDVLPGPVYARGFLRTYARFLGLNPQLYIDEYNARFGRFEDDDEPVLGRGPDSSLTDRSPVSLRSTLMLSLLALAAIAWFGLHDGRPAAKHDRSAAATPLRTSTNDTPTYIDRHQPVVSNSATGRAVPTAAHVLISIAGGTSWIEVRRGSATGPVVYAGLMAAGTHKRFGGRSQRLFVTAGAPSVVKLNIPGGGTGTAAATVGAGTQRTTWLVSPTQIRVSQK